jgi:hypothetical protein
MTTNEAFSPEEKARFQKIRDDVAQQMRDDIMSARYKARYGPMKNLLETVNNFKVVHKYFPETLGLLDANDPAYMLFDVYQKEKSDWVIRLFKPWYWNLIGGYKLDCEEKYPVTNDVMYFQTIKAVNEYLKGLGIKSENSYIFWGSSDY